MKLASLPVYQYATDDDVKATLVAAVRHGRACRKAGLRCTQVPKFVDPRMRDAWKYGWRWENEKIRRQLRAAAPKDKMWIGKGRKAWEIGKGSKSYPWNATDDQKAAWRYGWQQANKRNIEKNVRYNERALRHGLRSGKVRRSDDPRHGEDAV